MILSASQLKMWSLCRQLYYISYIEKTKQFIDPYTIAGSAIHKAIQQHYVVGDNIFYTFTEEFKKLLDDADSKGLLKRPEKITQAQKRGIQRLLKLDLTQFNPSEIELEFLLPFAGVQIRGFIDLIDGDRIIDHKSSSKLPSAELRANDPQFVIYAWAYQTLKGRLPAGVYWHHLEDGKLYPCDVLTEFDKKIAYIESIALELQATVELNMDYPKKEKDTFCVMVCDHHKRCWE